MANELKEINDKEFEAMLRLGYDLRRPKTRGECGEDRPCPWVGCFYHLYADITDVGALAVNQPNLDLLDLSHTCALDIADTGGQTLDFIGQALGVSRERVRQIEEKAMNRWRERARQGDPVIIEWFLHRFKSHDGTSVQVLMKSLKKR